VSLDQRKTLAGDQEFMRFVGKESHIA
jgi:hypothetical protein